MIITCVPEIKRYLKSTESGAIATSESRLRIGICAMNLRFKMRLSKIIYNYERENVF